MANYRIISNLWYIFVFTFIARSFLPILNIHFSVLTNLLLFIVIFISTLGATEIIFRDLVKVTFLVSISMIVTCILPSNDPDIISKTVYAIIQMAPAPIIGYAIIKTRDIKLARYSLVMVLILTAITAITTINGCELYPGAARDTSTGLISKTEIQFYSLLNIGNYTFVYNLVFIGLCVVFFYRLTRKRVIKVICLLFIFLCVNTFVAAEYTTAIIIFAIATVIVFLYNDSTQNKILIFCSLLAFIVIILFKETIASFFYGISDMTDSYSISERMQSIGDSLSGKNVEGSDMGERQKVWIKSLDSFCENPLWGGGKSGGHSFILDFLGRIGLLGLIVVYWQFKVLFDFFLKPFLREGRGIMVYMIFLVQIVFAFMNPTLFYIAMTFCCPICLMLFKEFNKSKI